MSVMREEQNSTRPRIAYYAEVYLRSIDTAFYDQLRAVPDSQLEVVAQWGANLEEFPTAALFLANDTRDPVTRARLAIERRLWKLRDGRKAQRWYEMPPHGEHRLYRHLSDSPVDLMYTRFAWNAIQISDVLERLERRVPLVFQAGGSDINAAGAFGNHYRARLAEVADRSSLILAVSDFLCDRILALGVPPEKAKRHYVGVDIPAVWRAQVEPDTFNVLAVSRLEKVKGVPHTIGAFALAFKGNAEVQLTIIGDGAERGYCERLTAELGIGEQVTFLGELSNKAVLTAMEHAQLFVQHSVRLPTGQEEGLGVTLIEAAARGLPSVSTISGGIPEIVENGKTGILVRPGDERGMAEAMRHLYEQPATRKRFGDAGRQRAETKFNLEAQNVELMRHFLDVV